MGGSKKGEPNSAYGSGGDPRGRLQNQSAHQQERYEQQQGPMVQAFAHNYGRGSESNYGDYTDIMNQYRGIASGGGSSSPGGGGGGGGGEAPTSQYDAFTVSPGRAGYTDPFNSYEGMTEFSKTGGYSKEDIGNMRARGTAPVRAAYGNAEREMGRARSLQGGYSPNAFAAQGRMAREQGQLGADAMQNVEAGLAEARNQGRRYGLTGMQGTEGQRLSADVDVSKFNTGLDFEGQKFNAGAYSDAQQRNNAAQERAAAARASAGAASSAAAAASRADQLRALQGMTTLYGTTPGMANTFGNQLLQGVGQGGEFGLGLMRNDIASQQLPGQYDQTMGRIQDITNYAGGIANAFLPNRNGQKPQITYGMGGTSAGNTVGGASGGMFGNVGAPSAPSPYNPYPGYGGTDQGSPNPWEEEEEPWFG